jgi:sugar (pentulose or hexulose) kinase
MINLEVANKLGLPIDVDIVAGTTDSTAACIASLDSQVKPGDAVTSLGSTLVVKIVSEYPIDDSASGIYSQPYDKFWLVGGGSNSGGAVLKYYFSPEQMQVLSAQIKPETPTNLNYYPLITKGERFPVNDPEFQPRITPKVDDDVVFFQGLLEGIADIEHRAYKLLHDLGAPYPTKIRTVGGGASNKAWQHIRENKIGVPVVCAVHSDAAYGTALIAAKYFYSTTESDNDQ